MKERYLKYAKICERAEKNENKHKRKSECNDGC